MKEDIENAKAENTEGSELKEPSKVFDRLNISPSSSPSTFNNNENHKIKSLSFEQWLSRNYPNVKFKELDCLSQQRIFKSFEKNEKYYQDHKDQIAQKGKKYYQDHKDQIKKYRQDHKDQIAQKGKKYCQDHKDQIAQKGKKYYQDHKDQIKKYRQDHKDQIKKYRQDHKDQIAQKGKKYRQDHKDQIKKYRQDHKDQIKKYRQDYYRKHKKDLRDFKKLSKHSSRMIL
jgi:hypothetical protein